jgi:hypothetical protein
MDWCVGEKTEGLLEKAYGSRWLLIGVGIKELGKDLEEQCCRPYTTCLANINYFALFYIYLSPPSHSYSTSTQQL